MIPLLTLVVAAGSVAPCAELDGRCRALRAIDLVREGRPALALEEAKRAVRVAPKEQLPFFARGLADAAVMRAEAVATGPLVPRTCDPLRLERVVEDLVAAPLVGGDPRWPGLVLGALERLAQACRDPGSLAALTSAILATYPAAAAAPVEIDLNRAGAGLTATAILRQVPAELTAKADPGPALNRRAQYRWLLEAWQARDRHSITNLDAQRLARALLVVGVAIERRHGSAGAGLLLDDLALLGRVGALHYLPVIDPASEWVPWLASARLSPTELGVLRQLTESAAHHEDQAGMALLVFKLRAVLALREPEPCARARGLSHAIDRLAGAAQELDRARFAALVKDTARTGLEAINHCPDGGFLVRRELAATLRRIDETGQPFPVEYDFVDP